MDLRRAQILLIKGLLPTTEKENEQGRPRQEIEGIIQGIFWILRTGACWYDLPQRYPPYQTCHRYFQNWVKAGIMDMMLKALAEDLRRRGKLDLSECFIDATFAGAKKGVLRLDPRSVGRGPKSWQLQTAMVYLSPYILTAPLATKQNWLQGPLITVSSAQNQEKW
jgi:transposase